MERLRSTLTRIDGKGYKAYKDLSGSYNFPSYTLTIDHVQGDPFAAPSRISIDVSADRAGFPAHLFSTKIRKTALEDFIGRTFLKVIRNRVKGSRGTGKSGQVRIEAGGQQVLLRNAVIVTEAGVEARITVGLPADGRTILGEEAETIFFNELPEVVSEGLFYENLDAGMVKAHVDSVEDQDFLRSGLKGMGLVAFVADGSKLPRQSGIDDRPMIEGALLFKSPETLSVTMELPNSGPVSGMGIAAGVTLIVGGGFHGKSTLLHAIERGIYNHIPGDGRERVATDPTAVKVRAEDGRSISDVDISPFIDNLPFGRDTLSFSTENASGSTSQAANIIEALECKSSLLLIDEDTSATNFMIRDKRMQELVVKEKEPITPFLHRVRELYDKEGVSTVIVMGGSGDYFSASDTVIMMDSYEPEDVTSRALDIAGSGPAMSDSKHIRPFRRKADRRPDTRRLNASRGKRDVKIDSHAVDEIVYGEHRIDLAQVEQLIDIGQTRAVGLMIYYYAQKYVATTPAFVHGLENVFRDVEERGLDILSQYKVGNLALPRLHEVAAAINRIREKG